MIPSPPEIVSLRREQPTTSVFSRDYLVMDPLIVWLRDIAVQYANGQLLDFGCGNKPYQSFFQPKIKKYVGVDLTQNQQNSVDIVLGDRDRLPIDANSYDTVLSTQVLEHVPDPDRYLEEASRVLQVGGHLILTCPGSYMLHEEPHDYYRYTIYGLKHLLLKHGLKPVHMDQAGGAWRLIGQTILNHIAFGRKYKIPLISKVTYHCWVLVVNILFSTFDSLNVNAKDTVNYMIIAQKI